MQRIDEATSIRLKKGTRDRLAGLGTKDSTFDQIIVELLKKVHKF